MIAFKHLFSAGYRVFFLLAGLFAILSMIVWEGWLAIHAAGGLVSDEPFAMAPHLWHAHEMIFGYGSIAIAGFLMTAAPNWTKAKGAGSVFFLAMTALWLAGRMAIWWSGSLSPVLVAVVDLAFLPVVAGRILAMLLARPKPQQMILLGMIALIWAGNLMVHLAWMGISEDTAYAGLRVGLLALSSLILILGGRVTPAFTRNAMRRAGREDGLPRDLPALAIPAIGGGIAVTLSMLVGLPEGVTGVLALVAGAAALARLMFWRGLWALRQPILWTLHLSYAAVALGFVALGVSMLTAHMFVFYYGVASSLTPPVAIAAYAAAPIAGANPLMTSFMSFRLGMAKFIIPFIFAFYPTILIVEEFSLLPFLWITARTCFCIWLFSSALSAFDLRKLSLPEVVLRFATAFTMLAVSPTIHVPAVAFGIALIVFGTRNRNSEPKEGIA
mgnify:CR=1 FL=1